MAREDGQKRKSTLRFANEFVKKDTGQKRPAFGVTMQSNKVCIPAPHKLSVGRDVLEEAGCELVLGMDQDEYPKHRYTKTSW